MFSLIAYGVLKMSGRRGSNSRPIAWKAIALPAELLPHLFLPFLTGNNKSKFGTNCGGGWIRTTVGIHQQIYSLPHLAALVHPQTTFQHNRENRLFHFLESQNYTLF